METNYTLRPFLKDSPITEISTKDFELYVIKFATILHLVYNKNINPTFLFLTIIKDKSLQNIFKKISGITTTREILKNILALYPNLLKSKIVKEESMKIIKKEKNAIRKSKKTL
jgi:hypothetical protein